MSQETLTTVDHNQLGMSFMDQLKQLRSDRDQDRERIRQLETDRTTDREELRSLREQNLSTIDFFIVRASTLDEWAEDREIELEIMTKQ